jgi:hypothetical protein
VCVLQVGIEPILRIAGAVVIDGEGLARPGMHAPGQDRAARRPAFVDVVADMDDEVDSSLHPSSFPARPRPQSYVVTQSRCVGGGYIGMLAVLHQTLGQAAASFMRPDPWPAAGRP